MSLLIYIQCFLVALIGWGIHTALKMRALQQRAVAAKAKWHPKQYFIEDYLSVIVSMLTILLFIFLADEFVKWKEEISFFIKGGFAFVGYFSSSIAATLFSAANKKLNNIIKEKTKD
jgi:hypothetical protein